MAKPTHKPNKFFITHLYPKELSIYGDIGNILAMQNMLDKIGWEWVYQSLEIGDKMPERTDFYFVGGGQDKDQLKITNDILKNKRRILHDVNDGVCLLSICGGYQLLGKEYIDGNGQVMEGLGVFPVITKSPDMDTSSRCIGNLVVESQFLGCKLVGFENHGGQTILLDKECEVLGNVITGYGNNFEDKIEGCKYKNAIGTYLHGSCLPKNPELTKWFIDQVASRKESQGYIGAGLRLLLENAKPDVSIAMMAKKQLVARFGG
jgi:lipid II isoglutaminyl synthase (glutamine-hydrolysing)